MNWNLAHWFVYGEVDWDQFEARLRGVCPFLSGAMWASDPLSSQHCNCAEHTMTQPRGEIQQACVSSCLLFVQIWGWMVVSH